MVQAKGIDSSRIPARWQHVNLHVNMPMLAMSSHTGKLLRLDCPMTEVYGKQSNPDRNIGTHTSYVGQSVLS